MSRLAEALDSAAKPLADKGKYMRKWYIAIAVFVLLLLAVVTLRWDREDYSKVEKETSPLIANIPSYINPGETKSKYFTNQNWTVIEDNTSSKNDLRPKYHFYAVTISHYKHLDEDGELILHFFNDRLESTWFFPENYSNYTSKLQKEAGLTVSSSGTLIPPFTEIITTADYRNRKYVRWSDNRLQKQHNRWIMRYS
jgi:hypothetical protein